MAAPLAEREREPMLLLDTTGSMNNATSATNAAPRHTTVHDALKIIVRKLAEEDAKAGEEEDGGGIRTITFAAKKGIDIEDLNPDNLEEKWAAIEWSGGTWIMPGWETLLDVYNEEFGALPDHERPIILAVVITDGEAMDTGDFAVTMATLPPHIFVALGVIGHGPDHDAALAQYQGVATIQPRMKVFTLGGESATGATIAQSLLTMIKAPVSAAGWA